MWSQVPGSLESLVTVPEQVSSVLVTSGGSGQIFFFSNYNGLVAFLNLRRPEVVTLITDTRRLLNW